MLLAPAVRGDTGRGSARQHPSQARPSRRRRSSPYQVKSARLSRSAHTVAESAERRWSCRSGTSRPHWSATPTEASASSTPSPATLNPAAPSGQLASTLGRHICAPLPAVHTSAPRGQVPTFAASAVRTPRDDGHHGKLQAARGGVGRVLRLHHRQVGSLTHLTRLLHFHGVLRSTSGIRLRGLQPNA